jgi:hypothetical protein
VPLVFGLASRVAALIRPGSTLGKTASRQINTGSGAQPATPRTMTPFYRTAKTPPIRERLGNRLPAVEIPPHGLTAPFLCLAMPRHDGLSPARVSQAYPNRYGRRAGAAARIPRLARLLHLNFSKRGIGARLGLKGLHLDRRTRADAQREGGAEASIPDTPEELRCQS